MSDQGKRLIWRRSSRCGNGACVEIAKDGDRYLIRDGKNPHLPPLAFTEAEWDAFRNGMLAGEFVFE